MGSADTDCLCPYPSHPSKTLSDLASKLIDNGLTGVDETTLERRLEQVGYFRLKGYWYPFLTPVESGSEKRVLPFCDGTSFRDIWDRYIFDQELRAIAFEGIVTIEIFLKSFLANELSSLGGEFGYTNHSNLPGLSYDEHLKCLSSLRSAFAKSDLPYLKHFKSKYSNPLPPYWMIVGCLSYGTLKLYFYQGAPESVKRKLASRLHIFNTNSNPAVRGDIKILSSWLEVIRQVRNMAAHHDRFWNESSNRISPKMPKHCNDVYADEWWGNSWDVFRNTSGPAAFLTMENYLLRQIGDFTWRDKFIALMNRYPQIPISDMGFPSEWQTLLLWG